MVIFIIKMNVGEDKFFLNFVKLIPKGRVSVIIQQMCDLLALCILKQREELSIRDRKGTFNTNISVLRKYVLNFFRTVCITPVIQYMLVLHERRHSILNLSS